MPKAKVTSKGQVTIPKEVREKMNLHPGDHIFFQTDQEGIIQIKKSDTSTKDRAGSLEKYARSKPLSIEEMNKR